MSAKCKTGGIVVGVKQTFRMIEQRRLAEVYVAEDADSFVTKGIEEAAERNGIRIIRVPSKRQLGMHCGIETGAAAAGKMLEEQQDTDTKAGKNTGEDPVRCRLDEETGGKAI